MQIDFQYFPCSGRTKFNKVHFFCEQLVKSRFSLYSYEKYHSITKKQQQQANEEKESEKMEKNGEKLFET